MSARQAAKRANDALADICKTYYRAIPLDFLFSAARMVGEPIQEDGSLWAGFLCGREGRATIELRDSLRCLQVQWFKMPSGNFEINAYVA